EGEVFAQFIEFYLGKRIENMHDQEYNDAVKFVDEHFKIVNIDKTYTAPEIIKIAEDESKISKVDALLLDPYNSLEDDYSLMKSTENKHSYDYKIAGRLRIFGKNNNIYTVLNCHAVTEALRKVDGDGHPIAPNKADSEGGGKFSNRADDFGTIHRLVQHPELWNETQFHMRKVKNTKTGGKPTPMKEPVIFKMQPGGCRFEINGQDIIRDIRVGKSVEQVNIFNTMTPSLKDIF
ncbi:MAG: Phi38:1, partial [Segetibacter sp.]|nr:Phi38:1 [Segetibacter sp.]